MSFDKDYPKRKDKRKPYRDSRCFDRTCRNNNSCIYCSDNRKYFDTKQRSKADDQLKEYTTGNEMTAYELESYLLPFDQWKTCDIPNEAREIINTSNNGDPIGLGYHESTGWFILGYGQGPFIIYQEKE